MSPSRGIEVAEFRYQPVRWPHPYRFVVGWRPQPEEPSEQLTLFKLDTYHYQVLGITLPLRSLTFGASTKTGLGGRVAHRTAQGRLGLGSIPTRHFFANETYFHLLLLAYNLVNWFERLCLPPEFQRAMLPTLRHQIFLMPALLRRTDNLPG